MYVGTQSFGTSKKEMEFLTRHGVTHLDASVPVAEEYKVQMACHLNDPPAPVLKGVERWNYPVFDGLIADAAWRCR